MPKKSTPVRGGVQRSKQRAQKSFELVRPVSEVQGIEEESTESSINEPSAVEAMDVPIVPSVAPNLSALPTVPNKKESKTSVVPKASVATKEAPVAAPMPVVPQASAATETPPVLPKGSAAARLAARRQGTQKASQRAAATLITPEHYFYVRKDLLFIAILAIIMFAALIALYFVPGIGS